MNLDDPTKPEFASVVSYGKFAQRVRRGRRYVWDKEIQAFLDTVLATRKDRDVIFRRTNCFTVLSKALDTAHMLMRVVMNCQECMPSARNE